MCTNVCNSCNMGMRDLPDMCAQSLRAEGVHIRQITSAYVTSNVCQFWHSKNCLNLQFSALLIYITMGT